MIVKDKMAGMSSSSMSGQDGGARSEKRQTAERKMVSEGQGGGKKAPGKGQKGHYRSHARQNSERKQIGRVQPSEPGSSAEQDGDIPEPSQGVGKERTQHSPGEPVRSTADLRDIYKSKYGSGQDNAETGENEAEAEDNGETMEGMTPSGQKKRAKVPKATNRNAMTELE